MKYRPDIDGLRALAIVVVVLYHARFPGMSGGYVGVDVFLVISGFLITGLILKDLADKSFSFVSFYERRIRRIFPALFSVLAVTFAVSFLFLLSKEFLQASRDLGAASIFSNNIFQTRYKVDYFAGPAFEMPLLHLWSLSVEEQFYLFFPLLLAGSFRFSRRTRFSFLLVLALSSLTACVWQTALKQRPAFFLTQFRLWEFLAGSLLHALPRLKSTRLAAALSWVGLSLIAGPVVLYDDLTLFPGVTAIWPVLGATLMIYSTGVGPHFLSRLLSSRVCTFVGKISYSLYLWHWPVLVMVPMLYPANFDLPARLWLIALSVLISVLSWRWIEKPFRREWLGFSRKLVFSLGGALALCFAVLGIKSSNETGRIANWQRSLEETVSVPPDVSLQRVKTGSVIGSLTSDPTPQKVILWGDSHAWVWLSTFKSHFENSKTPWGYLIQTGCAPISGVTPFYSNSRTPSDCRAWQDLQNIVKAPSVEDVVISARWERYYSPRVKDSRISTVRLCESGNCSQSETEQREIFYRGLIKEITDLKAAGKRVTLFGPVPAPGFDVRRAQRNARHFGFPAGTVVKSDLGEAFFRSVEVMRQVSEETGAQIFFPHQVLCQEECLTTENGKSLYIDDSHLSTAGTDFLWKAWNLTKQFSSSPAVPTLFQ